MRNSKKKFISVILSLCMAVGMMPALVPNAQAAGNTYPYWRAIYYFIVTANRTLTAVYEKEHISAPSYTITVNAADGGTVTGGGSYEKGKNATVTATANEGYRFDCWMENGSKVSTSASHRFTVNSDRTLAAVFEKAPVVKPSYIITTTASPSEGGTVGGDGQYLVDTNVAVTATPNNGYVFKGWTENGRTVSTSASYSFTASASRTLIAVFEKSQSAVPTAPTDTTWSTVAAEAEVNDTIVSGNKISVNTEIAGSISKSSDVDWFVFQIPDDGHISLTFAHDFVNSSSYY